MKLKRRVLIFSLLVLGSILIKKFSNQSNINNAWAALDNYGVYVYQKRPSSQDGQDYLCPGSQEDYNCMNSNLPITIYVKLEKKGNSCYYKSKKVYMFNVFWENKLILSESNIDSSKCESTYNVNLNNEIPAGKYNVATEIWHVVDDSRNAGRDNLDTTTLRNTFQTRDGCDIDSKFCTEPLESQESNETLQGQMHMCGQVKTSSTNAYEKCLSCVLNNNGVWTAIGCINVDSTNIIQSLIKIGLLIGGGVTLLIILAGAFTLTISQGDPKKTSEAKEMITSAIIGLIFIIFSVSILQLIGVEILNIPEFGEKTQEEWVDPWESDPYGDGI